MPWSESLVKSRMEFVREHCTGKWSVEELSRRFGICPKTGFRILARFAAAGIEGLADRSRARRTQSHATSPEIVRRIIDAKQHHPCWGPRKLLALLERRHPEVDWPSRSTFGTIFEKHGLVTKRRPRRPSLPSKSGALLPPSEPNDLWCTDFKGHRLSESRERLEPFTLGDAFSRYSLACTLVGSTSFASVWPIVRRCFKEYGMPRRLRSDNGPPFASTGLAGLSQLAVLLIRLGIRPERITPGKPQQNGMLERFHLTLELETLSPPAATPRLQERVLQRFRREYNEVRPHQALDDRTPADVYAPSSQKFPRRLPVLEYPTHVPVRSVHSDGAIRWAGKDIFLSQTLAGERVGFQQITTSHWSIRLGPAEVAIFDEATASILRHDRLVWIDQSHNT